MVVHRSDLVIAEEQSAVDHAHRHLELNRRRTEELSKVSASASAKDEADRCAELERWAAGNRVDGQQLVLMRVDVREEGEAETFYIGRRLVRDEKRRPIVVKWSTDAAVRWRLERSTDTPGTVTLRRALRCKGTRVVGYVDELVREPTSGGGPSPAELAHRDLERQREEGTDPFLLEVLDGARDGVMRDIVETIRRDQLALVSDDRNGALVIQGGPGTGKTAIGLHRVTWLIDNGHFQPGEILVLGPGRHFLDYVREVLPSLGNRGVTTLSHDALWAAEQGGGTVPEPAESAGVKADVRMASVLARAVDNTVREGAWRKFTHESEVRVRVDGTWLSVPEQEVGEVFAEARDSAGTLSERRRRFTDALVDRLLDQAPRHVRRQGGSARSRIAKALEGLVNATWPRISEARLWRRLLSDADTLERAGAGILEPGERAALIRPEGADGKGTAWTAADLPCLEELRVLLTGWSPERRYRHVVVDEAQNLTPMQLRSLSRRCPSGSFTVLGDLAQSTGPYVHRDWAGFTSCLDLARGWELRELDVGYRIPRQVMQVAVPAGVTASGGVAFPRPVRPQEAGEVTMTAVDGQDMATAVRDTVSRLLAGQGDEHSVARSVAVITADGSAHRETLSLPLAEEGVSEHESRLRVLPVGAVSGLEFDHVVLVEPDEIVGLDGRGHGRLYVALTRCTQSLTVLHERALPGVLVNPESGVPERGAERRCARYDEDRHACRNRTHAPDGWCRTCAGYRVAEPLRVDQETRVLPIPSGADTTGHLDLVQGWDSRVNLTPAARADFAILHRADAVQAEIELRMMAREFRTSARRIRRRDGTWLLDLEGYRLVLDPEATTVIGYGMAHRERSFAQFRWEPPLPVPEAPPVLEPSSAPEPPEPQASPEPAPALEPRPGPEPPPVPEPRSGAEPTTGEPAAGRDSLRALLTASRARLRTDRRWQWLSHYLLGELSLAGLGPRLGEVVDVMCEGPEGAVHFEVMGENGHTYAAVREAVLRVREAALTEGAYPEHLFLVLPRPPEGAWVPAVVGEAFGVRIIWWEEGEWRGEGREVAFGGVRVGS